MPSHVGKSSSCPKDRPWTIIKNATGKPQGHAACFPTPRQAGAQLSAVKHAEEKKKK